MYQCKVSDSLRSDLCPNQLEVFYCGDHPDCQNRLNKLKRNEMVDDDDCEPYQGMGVPCNPFSEYRKDSYCASLKHMDTKDLHDLWNFALEHWNSGSTQ